MADQSAEYKKEHSKFEELNKPESKTKIGNLHEAGLAQSVEKNHFKGGQTIISPIYLVKLLLKLILCAYLSVILCYIESCESDLNYLVKVTNFIVLTEAVFLVFFLLSMGLNKHCLKLSSCYLSFYVIFDFLMYFFYLNWGGYYTVKYYYEEECEGESDYWLFAQNSVLAYLILFNSIILCCCGIKTCLVVSSHFTSPGSEQGNLTKSLLNEDKEH